MPRTDYNLLRFVVLFHCLPVLNETCSYIAAKKARILKLSLAFGQVAVIEIRIGVSQIPVYLCNLIGEPEE